MNLDYVPLLQVQRDLQPIQRRVQRHAELVTDDLKDKTPMGFDRLVMLATGAQRIEQVLWAPVAEAP